MDHNEVPDDDSLGPWRSMADSTNPAGTGAADVNPNRVSDHRRNPSREWSTSANSSAIGFQPSLCGILSNGCTDPGQGICVSSCSKICHARCGTCRTREGWTEGLRVRALKPGFSKQPFRNSWWKPNTQLKDVEPVLKPHGNLQSSYNRKPLEPLVEALQKLCRILIYSFPNFV